MSAHAPGHLAEFAAGRALGHPLTGDENLSLGREPGVPEVRAEGRALFERAGVVLERTGAVRALIHPVPDPGRHAESVLTGPERLASAA
ncbi:hypothetical protein [Streptomyces griseoluteus]|uniref:hypothetical protein n=1 Tax=Streptomyces griseoluteus TaxID=29306 RepID=UPI003416FD36